MQPGLRGRCSLSLLLIVWSLAWMVQPALARPSAAADRARLLRTLDLIQRPGAPLARAAKLAQSEDWADSFVVVSPGDPGVVPPGEGTGVITGVVSGVAPEQLQSATVAAWTDYAYVEGKPEDDVMYPSRGFAFVAPDGSYRIEGLGPGEYYLVASAEGYVAEYYDGVTDLAAAQRVSVGDGETVAGIDFALERFVPGTGSIAGTVRSPSGQPIGLAVLYAYSPENPFLYGKTQAGPDGAYVIPELKSGSYYVEVWADGYMQGFYNGAQTLEEAELVGVTEPGQTAGIDFVLSTGGAISGYVYDEAGEPVAGAYVQASMRYYYEDQRPDDGPQVGADGAVRKLAQDATGEVSPDSVLISPRGGGAGAREGWAVTDESGFYRMSGLVSGDYYVMVQLYSTWTYAYQWYQDTDAYEKATPVPVGPDEEVTHIDFHLAVPGGHSAISGRIADSQGQGVAGAFVTVQEDVDRATEPVRYIWAYASTDEDGRYVVGELPEGRYLVSAASQSGWQYVQRWYVDASTPQDATAIVLGRQERREGVDIALPFTTSTASIAGTVRDTAGRALAYAFVQVSAADGGQVRADGTVEGQPLIMWAYGQSDENGAYRVDRLPAGSFTVQASYGNGETFGQQWFDHAAAPEQATAVVLADGQQLGGVDFDIAVRPLYGSVAGTVSDAATGTPLTRAYVELAPVDWNYRSAAPFRFAALYAVTDEAGTFRIDYVSEGAYLVTAYANGGQGPYVDPAVDALMTPIKVLGGEVSRADLPLAIRREGDGAIRGTVSVDTEGGPSPLWDRGLSDVDSSRGGAAAEDLAPGATDPVVDIVPGVDGDPASATAPPIAVVLAAPVEDPDRPFTAVTSPDGTYSLGGLPDGDYIVRAFAPGFIGEYFDDAYGADQAVAVHVDSGSPTAWADFALSPAYYLCLDDRAEGDAAGAPSRNASAGVYGTVTDEGGNALAGATVYLLDEAEHPVAYVQSAADGTYQMSGVVPGGYRLYASKLGFDGTYNGGAGSFGEAMAMPVSADPVEVNLRLAQAPPTAVEEEEGAAVPQILALQRNYPNPFNPSTQISFSLPTAGHVTLRVFDVLGQQVALLLDGWVPAGQHAVTFDGAGLSSGTYLCALEFGGQRIQRNMSLVK